MPRSIAGFVLNVELKRARVRPTISETPIIKVYSSSSTLSELLEDAAAKEVLASYVPAWEAVPGPMRDMTVDMLSETPFVNLTDAQREAMNAQLKSC